MLCSRRSSRVSMAAPYGGAGLSTTSTSPTASPSSKTVNCVSRNAALDCEQAEQGVDRASPESPRGTAMPDDVPSDALTFGDLLRRHRRAQALTQEALAERAGVSARAVSDLERGARSHPYRETATLL